ncbi:ABC superfamily ATP binding cassette transporter [Enterobacter hormaechei ATCC 49162]|nr:ABC superfamily ATP binding cassette transporter [Enterobacter hormaechei ATCC 49162]
MIFINAREKTRFAGRQTYNVSRFTVFFFYFATSPNDYILFTFIILKLTPFRDYLMK